MAAEVSKIQDYAIIGNGRSAALISKRGSLDWLCWPRFDSPSIFGAILDSKIGGRWSIRPARDSEINRRYIDNTNVLETSFVSDTGKVVLTNFMPVPTVERQLEPPGFLGLHYGIRTPISVLVAHTVFGAILGTFYVVK